MTVSIKDFSYVVCGPQGSGKTTAARALAEHLGLTFNEDDGHPALDGWLTAGVVYTKTTRGDFRGVRVKGHRVSMGVEDARRAVAHGLAVKVLNSATGEAETLHITGQRVQGSAPITDGTLASMLSVPGYEKLADVLARAFEQSAFGKGHQRHSTGQPFHEQPIATLTRMYGPGFAYGQAGKKMEEALRLPREDAVRELLGAIVYIAAGIIVREEAE